MKPLDLERVKFFVINTAMNSDYNIESCKKYPLLLEGDSPKGYTFRHLVAYQFRVWRKEYSDRASRKVIKNVIRHCLQTGQVTVDEEGYVHKGTVMFENAKSVSEKAQSIAEAIYKDVTGRRGWRQEADNFDDDVIAEIKNTWAVIIDKYLDKK